MDQISEIHSGPIGRPITETKNIFLLPSSPIEVDTNLLKNVKTCDIPREGSISSKTLYERIRARGVQVQIIDGMMSRQEEPQRFSPPMRLAIVTLSDLGLLDKRHTTREVFEKATQIGLELCDPAIGLRYFADPNCEPCSIGMRPVGGNILTLEPINDSLSVVLTKTSPLNLWREKDKFAFRIPVALSDDDVEKEILQILRSKEPSCCKELIRLQELCAVHNDQHAKRIIQSLSDKDARIKPGYEPPQNANFVAYQKVEMKDLHDGTEFPNISYVTRILPDGAVRSLFFSHGSHPDTYYHNRGFFNMGDIEENRISTTLGSDRFQTTGGVFMFDPSQNASIFNFDYVGGNMRAKQVKAIVLDLLNRMPKSLSTPRLSVSVSCNDRRPPYHIRKYILTRNHQNNEYVIKGGIRMQR